MDFPNISTEAQHTGTQNFLELEASGNGNLQRRGLEVGAEHCQMANEDKWIEKNHAEEEGKQLKKLEWVMD